MIKIGDVLEVVIQGTTWEGSVTSKTEIGYVYSISFLENGEIADFSLFLSNGKHTNKKGIIEITDSNLNTTQMLGFFQKNPRPIWIFRQFITGNIIITENSITGGA